MTSGHRLPISTGDCTGPSICCSSVRALPSQNCVKFSPALNTVGALMVPGFPSTPIETLRPSSPPLPRSWQLTQAVVLSLDNLGS